MEQFVIVVNIKLNRNLPIEGVRDQAGQQAYKCQEADIKEVVGLGATAQDAWEDCLRQGLTAFLETLVSRGGPKITRLGS